MLTATEILQQAERKYADFVDAHFRGDPFFPLVVRFGQPKPSSSLAQLRRQVEDLWLGSHEFTGHGYRIEFETRKMRLHGEQRLPKRVWIENADDFLRFIGKATQFAQLQQDIEAAVAASPEMAPWAQRRARALITQLQPGEGRALGLAVSALHRNPKPNCFAREIPLPDVSGKFIESRLQLVATILREIESPAWSDSPELHEQLGLRVAPRMLRLMWLDGQQEDFGVPADRFHRLPSAKNVVIVENLRSFLTLPAYPNTLAVFGEGRASQTLGRVTWLSHARCFYWGDMDPYGYNILAALRSSFSGIQSVLMSAGAFERYRKLTARMPIPDFRTEHDVAQPDPSWHLLDSNEMAAAKSTLADTVSIVGVLHGLGIEQEKIPRHEAAEELLRLLAIE